MFGRPCDSDTLVLRLERDHSVTLVSTLSLWFRKNGLKVNANKTQLLVIGTTQNLRLMPPAQVEFLGSTITGSQTVKNLGVVFDQNMTFSAHVDNVVRRCVGLLSGLSHSRHAPPADTLSVIVQALVVSALRYCISVYGVCGATQMARLQKLLNFSVRIISGHRKHERISDVVGNLKWLSAENLYRYHSLSMLTLARSGPFI